MPKLLPSIEEDYNEVVANAGGDTGSHLVRNVNASLKNIGDSTTDLRPVVSSQMLYPSAPNASEQVLRAQQQQGRKTSCSQNEPAQLDD